eukprot:1702300-Rhodomonas_salina.1
MVLWSPSSHFPIDSSYDAVLSECIALPCALLRPSMVRIARSKLRLLFHSDPINFPHTCSYLQPPSHLVLSPTFLTSVPILHRLDARIPLRTVSSSARCPLRAPQRAGGRDGGRRGPRWHARPRRPVCSPGLFL